MNVARGRALLLLGAGCAIVVLATGCRRDPVAAASAFIASGDRYASEGQFEAAAIEYRNALEQQPQSASASFKLGLAYERLQQPDKAFAAFVRVTELDDANDDASLRVAAAWLAGARYEEAERFAGHVIAHDPHQVRALVIAASALDGLGRSTAAKRRIDEALDVDPTSSPALVALASWQLRRADVKSAYETLRQAVAHNPQSTDAWTAFAITAWRLGDTAAAEAAFKRVMAIDAGTASSRRQLASFYVQTGRAALAEPYLRALAESSPNDRLALADAYLAAGKPESAIALIEALATNSDTRIAAQAQLRQAALAKAAGRRHDARAYANLAMKDPATEPQAHVLAAELELEEGTLDGALEHAAKATSLQPQWGEARCLLAMIHLARGDLDNAERELKRARDLIRDPGLVDGQLARLALARGDAAAAARLARQSADGARTPAAYALLSQSLRADGRVNDAFAILSSARRQWTSSVELDTELGFVELAAHRPDRARTAFNRALRASPSATLSRIGLVLSQIAGTDVLAARTSLGGWRTAEPSDVSLAILSSQIDLAEGHVAAAEATLVDVLRRAPRSPAPVETLAQLYLSTGRRNQALQYYQRVTELRPRPFEALTVVGMLKQEAADRPGAIEAYERALAISPEAGVAANNLAWLYADDNRLEDAARLAEQAVKSLNDSPPALDTLGWIAYRRQRYAIAIQHLSHAVTSAPRNPTYHYHLGLAYASAGRHAEAGAELERTIALSHEPALISDARRARLALPQATR